MNLRCDDSLVQLYVEGVLAPAERLIVGEHVRGCPACQQRVLAYKALMWDLAHPEAEPPVPPELAALSDRLMADWDWAQAHPARRPALAPAPARSTLGYTTLWLQVSPVATGPASLAQRLAPTARRALPALGQAVSGFGRGLGRLFRGQVKER